MSNSTYHFQYCQKIVLFSSDWQEVFVAKRRGEADYDGTYSFIGGKMETTDESIVAGIQREKNEEIGNRAKLLLFPDTSHNVLYRKKDGSSMILPHYIAVFECGEIRLNKEEYSEYKWVPIDKLQVLEPKVENLFEIVLWALEYKQHLVKTDLLEI